MLIITTIIVSTIVVIIIINIASAFCRSWRRSAHDHSYMDLAGSSLVSRVCNQDAGLLLRSCVSVTIVRKAYHSLYYRSLLWYIS